MKGLAWHLRHANRIGIRGGVALLLTLLLAAGVPLVAHLTPGSFPFDAADRASAVSVETADLGRRPPGREQPSRSGSGERPPGLVAAPRTATSSYILGDPNVEGGADSNSAGVAEAFPYTATATGTALQLSLYVDSGNSASSIVVGLYTNAPTNDPGTLLAQATIANPTPGWWNTVALPAASVTNGATYWIAILAPAGAGTVSFRDVASGGRSETSSQSNLSALPSTWSRGAIYNNSPMSAYAVMTSGAAPVISSISVSDVTDGGATITWTTDEPATSQVNYGTTPFYGMTTTLDQTLLTSHSQTLGGLTPNTTYSFQVVSSDVAGHQAVSGNVTLTTLPASAGAASQGEWGPLLQWPLVDVHMNLLSTGEVLMFDAWELGGTPSARLWNPSSQTFTNVPEYLAQMFCADQVQLADGRVLIAGGHNGSDYGIKNTVSFDPLTRVWTRLADMNWARWYPSTIALSDGRVLALGGEITPGVIATTPEIYDPNANTWTPLPGATLDVDEYPQTFLLPNGTLFVSAGADSTSRILDVGTQTWTVVGTNPNASGTATMYRPGKILATGGGNPVQTTAATIDLTQSSPTWQPTGSMSYPRFQHNLVVLPDGNVLAVGGSNIFSLESTSGILPAEIWNATTGTWTTVAAMQDLRLYHSTALLLPDGRVLSAGGGRLAGTVDYLTAQIYSPPYLFQGPRPTITSAPSATTYGGSMTVQTPDAATISSVAFIRLGSVTHTYNSDQRYIPLSFTAAAGSLTITSPASATIAPPGYYMLFIVNGAGVPSVARIVAIGGASSGGSTPTPTLTSTPTATATATPTPTATRTATPTVTPTVPAPLLVGDRKIEKTLDNSPAGTAKAFLYTASASGTAGKIVLYVDRTNTASQIVVGLYANSASNDPGTLLAQATISPPTRGAWNTASLPATNIVSGRKYWIAVLGPSGTGTVQFRDVASGTKCETSAQGNLTNLPASWSPGAVCLNSPMSAYVTP